MKGMMQQAHRVFGRPYNGWYALCKLVKQIWREKNPNRNLDDFKGIENYGTPSKDFSITMVEPTVSGFANFVAGYTTKYLKYGVVVSVGGKGINLAETHKNFLRITIDDNGYIEDVMEDED